MDLIKQKAEVETLRRALEEQAYTIEQQTELLDAVDARSASINESPISRAGWNRFLKIPSPRALKKISDPMA